MAFATAFGTLVTGAFLVGFVQLLGGSDIWIGILSAIPSLVGIFQVPGAIWGRRYTSYKGFVLPGGLIWRLFYIPLIALPLLPIGIGVKLTLLTLCVGLASVASNLVNPIYNDWLAELVPAQSRGTYFARRNAIATATGAVVGIVGGFILDSFRSNKQDKIGFTTIFAMGIVCAAISFALFVKMRDLTRQHPVRQNLKEGVKAIGKPFGDRDFRRVLVFLGVFLFGQSFGGNLFAAYALETLHLDFRIIQGLAVSYAAGNVLASRFWGFLSDKYGNKPALFLAAGGLALNPWPWIITQPNRFAFDSIFLLSTHVVMGAVFGGVALCQLNIIFATAKEEDRANYIGAGLTVISLIGGFAPLLGAALMSELRHHLSAEMAYKTVFGVTSGLRFMAVFVLIPVREEGSAKVGTAIRDLRGVTPRGVRAMRRLAKSSDVDTRAEAIFDVGTERLTLAADEIIKALHDPQPRVRREAAAALARLNDPRALGELIHQVEEHPDLLEEETIRALGELGRPEAIPVLIRTLQSPRSLLRREAARSLGRLGHPDATNALIQAAADPSDADLRRAALQALRIIGAREAEAVFADALLDPLPSVRIAAAEAVSEMSLGGALENLREALAYYDDEASAEVAYALGAVGEIEDLPIILREAADSISMITRRRCLMGAARMLGVERVTYRLLLLEGMERDSAILELLKTPMKDSPRLRSAMKSYSSGQEDEALVKVAKIIANPALQVLADHPVAEAFIVAVAVVADAK